MGKLHIVGGTHASIPLPLIDESLLRDPLAGPEAPAPSVAVFGESLAHTAAVHRHATRRKTRSAKNATKEAQPKSANDLLQDFLIGAPRVKASRRLAKNMSTEVLASLALIRHEADAKRSTKALYVAGARA